MKFLLVLILSLTACNLWASSEEDFLLSNENYSDLYLQYLIQQPTDQQLFEELSLELKNARAVTDAAEFQLQLVRQQILDLKEHLKDLTYRQSHRTEIKDKLNNERRQRLDRIQHINDKISELDDQITSTKQQVKDNHQSIQKKRQKQNTLKNRRQQRKQRLGQLQQRKNTLQSKINKNKFKIKGHQKKIQKLKGELDQANNQQTKIQLRKKIKTQREKIKVLRADNKTKRTKLQQVIKRINKVSLTIKKLKKRINELNREIFSLNIDNIFLNGKVSEYEDKQKDLHSQKTTHKLRIEDIDDKIDELNHLPQEIQRIQQLIEKAQDDEVTFTLKLTQAEDIENQKQFALNKLSDEVSAKKDQLIEFENRNDNALDAYYQEL